MSTETLRITELFLSLQGEARSAGYPTVFVRLTGCPLRCQYCDSEYAFDNGERLPLSESMAQVEQQGVKHVCVTGGEPLAQPNCHVLLKALCERGYQVSLETSGAMDITAVDTRVSIVMDLKTPASKEAERNRYDNISHLARKDQIKFVLCNRGDYDWARFKLDEYQLVDTVGDVLFSPSYGQLEPAELAQWIIDDKLCVRFQTQLHKTLWGDKPGC